MIRGYFVREPGVPATPYVVAKLRLMPQSGFEPVSFIIDTGSDFTILNPLDASRLWLDYQAQDFATGATNRILLGIGGQMRVALKTVDLKFTDDELGTLGSSMTVHVAAPDEADQWDLPSLLGRDVLQAFTLTVDARSETVTLAT